MEPSSGAGWLPAHRSSARAALAVLGPGHARARLAIVRALDGSIVRDPADAPPLEAGAPHARGELPAPWTPR
jgi:hypothetical protein